jgi:hypothetical protein
MTTTSHPELEGLDRYKFGWADSDAAGAAATGTPGTWFSSPRTRNGLSASARVTGRRGS